MKSKKHLISAGIFIVVALINLVEAFWIGRQTYVVICLLSTVLAVFNLARYFGWKQINRIAGIDNEK